MTPMSMAQVRYHLHVYDYEVTYLCLVSVVRYVSVQLPDEVATCLITLRRVNVIRAVRHLDDGLYVVATCLHSKTPESD